MITNFSGMQEFETCRTKHFKSKHDRLTAWQEADPLVLGGAFHLSAATLFSTGSTTKAQDEAEKEYRDRSMKYFQEKEVDLMPEEERLIERNAQWLRASVALFADNYSEGGVQVIWPEVEFVVELPNTNHHCYFLHKLLYGESNLPYWGKGCEDPRCQLSHIFKGRTDAIIKWKNAIWLFEHKTSAQTGDIFYQRFNTNDQPTGYIYGIWKSTSLRPHGFLLNVIKKPNAAFKGNPLDKIGYEREAYIRTDEDLEHFEQQMIQKCTNYEHAFANNLIYDNRQSCMSYNRKCYFYDLCTGHRDAFEDEFRRRPLDYIEYEYYMVLHHRGVDLKNLPAMTAELYQEIQNFNSKEKQLEPATE